MTDKSGMIDPKSGLVDCAKSVKAMRAAARKRRMAETPKKRKLDSSDIATILAALRMFQREYEDCDSATIQAAWPDYFALGEETLDDDGQTIEQLVVPEPLGSMDIDELCEQINLGEVKL